MPFDPQGRGLRDVLAKGNIMTPAQLRAARALLRWPRKHLKTVSGVSVETLKNFESGRSKPAAATFEKLSKTFASQGIAFICDRDVEGVVRVRAAQGVIELCDRRSTP